MCPELRKIRIKAGGETLVSQKKTHRNGKNIILTVENETFFRKYAAENVFSKTGKTAIFHGKYERKLDKTTRNYLKINMMQRTISVNGV